MRGQVAGLQSAAASNAQRWIDQGRIVEHDLLRTLRRAVVFRADHRHRRFHHALGDRIGIGDGCRRQEELRLAPVKAADAAQSAQDVSDVRPEDATIDVHLVDHDCGQIHEKLGPPRVLREDAGMQHVGIREHDARAVANLGALAGGRIAVVGRGRKESGRMGEWVSTRSWRFPHSPTLPFSLSPLLPCSQPLLPRVQLRQLILRQRLRRVEIERSSGRIGQQAVEDRQVVAERLAAGRRRNDGDMLAAQARGDRLGLMRIELADASRRHRLNEPGIEARRERRIARAARRHMRPAGHVAHELRLEPERLKRAFDGHEKIIPRGNR